MTLYDRLNPFRRTAVHAPREPIPPAPEPEPDGDRDDDLPEFEDALSDDESDDETDPLDSGDVVFTQGVQSTVLDQNGSRVGHALLLDADDADPLDVLALPPHLPGVTAVFESSEGSYHLWNLSVRDLSETVLKMMDLSVCDDAHAGSSYRRGYSVLRFVAKVRDDGETYKERPSLEGIWVNEGEGLPQSRPHAEALVSLADEQGSESDAERLRDALDSETLRWVGDRERLLTDQYATVSDDVKDDLRSE